MVLTDREKELIIQSLKLKLKKLSSLMGLRGREEISQFSNRFDELNTLIQKMEKGE